MPIYEYACAACESEFEVEQRITEDPLKTCPKCRSRRIKKLISLTNFSLKGGGWYADGYTRKSDTKSDAAKSEGAKSDGAKSDAGDSSAASTSDKASSSSDSGSDKKGKKAAKGKKAVA